MMRREPAGWHLTDRDIRRVIRYDRPEYGRVLELTKTCVNGIRRVSFRAEDGLMRLFLSSRGFSVNGVPTYFVLDSMSHCRKNAFRQLHNDGACDRKPAIILHSISDY